MNVEFYKVANNLNNKHIQVCSVLNAEWRRSTRIVQERNSSSHIEVFRYVL